MIQKQQNKNFFSLRFGKGINGEGEKAVELKLMSIMFRWSFAVCCLLFGDHKIGRNISRF